MAEHLEKLSEIVEPIKEIKSSIDSNALNNRRCVDKDNEPIVCDVCGCVNKHGATMCKMCSNYLTDSNRR